MARLIDAKALEKQIKEAFEDSNPVLKGQMLRWIRKQSTVDAVEVVHGRWIETKNGFHCSNCKKKPGQHWAKRGVFLSDYCPNCGAKMDGDGNAAD